jgi:hypothetical protein
MYGSTMRALITLFETTAQVDALIGGKTAQFHFRSRKGKFND